MFLIIFVGFRLYVFLLVGGLEDVLFFHVLRIVIPIASYFSEGVAQQPTSLSSGQGMFSSAAPRNPSGRGVGRPGSRRALRREDFHWSFG